MDAMRNRVTPAGPAGPGPMMPPGGGMPIMKKGGKVKKTGPHMLHKGEKVLSAKAAKKAKSRR